MCGITGIIKLNGVGIDVSCLRKMAVAIAGRGPDDCGFALYQAGNGLPRMYSDHTSCERIRSRDPDIGSDDAIRQSVNCTVGLAHRRFSVLELSHLGHQPMTSSCGRYSMVFNGEIYNYLEIAEKLLSAGRMIRSKSDSEVLLEAFAEFGVYCFSMLRGFWALAIIDHLTNSVMLSRDRLGKKPLYWFRTDDTLFFSSEIKGLLATGSLEVSENRDASENWLSRRLRDYDENTFFTGVARFPTGSYATVENLLSDRVTRFWSIDKVERLKPSEISIDESIAGLRQVLGEAVQIRLRSDLPMAVSLSGGLDSSAILAYAKQFKPDIGVITTHFPTMDETPYARKVARHLGSDLEVISPDLEDVWNEMDGFVEVMEEPFHSPNLIVSKRNLQILRSRGYGVVLNGAVGDEVFAGYGTAFLPAQVDLVRSGRFREVLANHRQWTEGQASLRKLAGAVLRSFAGTRSRSSMLSEDAHAKLLRTLVPYWLSSGDKSDMAVPVEVRCPFVDHFLIEFGLRIPTSYLVRDGWHKWILRKAIEPMLPREVVWRREKMGYPFPIERMIEVIPARIRDLLARQDRGDLDLRKWHHISYALWRHHFGLVQDFAGDRSQGSCPVDHGN